MKSKNFVPQNYTCDKKCATTWCIANMKLTIIITGKVHCLLEVLILNGTVVNDSKEEEDMHSF